MNGREYAFLTRWRIRAPRERVWEEILHVERWIAWWRGLERAEELARGDVNRIGAQYRLTWRGALPYRLAVDMTVVRVEPNALLESLAHGELEGHGTWRLASCDDATAVEYEWRVRTTKPWMNVITPLARPLFSWNHDVIMRHGERGLKRLLETRSRS